MTGTWRFPLDVVSAAEQGMPPWIWPWRRVFFHGGEFWEKVRRIFASWWVLLLRGICAILFGVLTFVWPGITLLTLVLLYGAYALADGVLALAEAVMGGAPAPRWWLALVGLLGIAVGVLTFAWPGITALVLLLFIAGWAIATGLLQIVGAIRLRKEIENEWLLIASGVLSVIFGLILVVQPGTGALALLYVIGIYAILYGILEIWLSLRLRSHATS
jgi:uncharacterized membrane protein HdeD (DUF308 family)